MQSTAAQTWTGASDLSAGDLRQLVARLEAERQRLQEENARLRLELKERYDFSNLVGTSAPMRQVHEHVTQVARANTTVLLRGESGTGKELLAHAIHYNSPRAKRPFVKVSCAALPQDLVESELFGTSAVPSPARTAARRDASRSPTAAPCSWMRSAN